jgi:hypothetical protein
MKLQRLFVFVLTIVASSLIVGNVAYAITAGVPISVPSASGAGYGLVSTITGAYVASSTNALVAGSNITFTGGTPYTFGPAVTISASGGSGKVGTSSSETSGRIPFWTTNSATPALLSGGSANFVWDNTNRRLGIGTSSPYATLSVAGTIVGQNFVATSSSATSTFAGDVAIGSNAELPNPYLFIGTSTRNVPLYGRVQGDVIDAEYDWNGQTSINVANVNIGSCASATFFVDGNNPSLGGYYGTFSFLNDGWTGVGCSISVGTAQNPEAVAIANPTGEMDFVIASTTNNGFADFNWFSNTNTQLMKLTNAGALLLGSTSVPFSSQLATVSSDVGTSLSSDSAAGIAVINSNTTVNNSSQLGFGTYDTNGAYMEDGRISVIHESHAPVGSQGDMVFLVGPAGGTTPIEAARFQPGRQFLIGTTTNPNLYKEVVAGQGLWVSGKTSPLFIVGDPAIAIPAFQVNDAISGNGVALTTSTGGSGTTLQEVSTAANEVLNIYSKGTGNVNIGPGGVQALTIGSAQISLNPGNQNKGTISTTGYTLSNGAAFNTTAPRFSFTDSGAPAALTASTEMTDAYFNLAHIDTHADGAIATNRNFRITPSTETFAPAGGTNASKTIASSTTFSIDGPPIQGANGNFTNDQALFIGAGTALTSSTTNAYGLVIQTPTGATNNYAASTSGRWIMNGLTVSGAAQTSTICQGANGELFAENTTCALSALKFKKDVHPYTVGLDVLMKVQPSSYYLKTPDPRFPDDAKQHIGFIADWMDTYFPQLTVHDNTGAIHGFDYEKFTAAIVSWEQQMETQIVTILDHQKKQDTQIATQQKEIQQLQAEVKKLESKKK